MKATLCALCVLTLVLAGLGGMGCSASNGPTPGNTNNNGGGDDNTNGNENGSQNQNQNSSPANDNTNDNQNGNDNAGTDEALIKTHILMDENLLIMRPKAGDDLIVWGDADGVYYIIPSETDTDATEGIEFPESARFAWTHFAVAGKKVALVTGLGEVRVFDTATGQNRDFPPSQILLENTQLTEDTLPGLTQASGELFATLNNTRQVSDGNGIKVIDVAGSNPDDWEVISFPNPIDRLGSPVEDWAQVAVDAGTRRVAALADNDSLYVWDIDDPAADPVFVDMSLATDLCCVNAQVQMHFENGLLLHQQDPDQIPLGIGSNLAVLLDVDQATLTVFDRNPTTASAPMFMAGGSFGYFQWREELDAQMGAGASYRSAIGRIADAPAATLSSQSDTYALRPTDLDFGSFPQEQCFGDELKKIGYGASIAITPDGGRWFLAGVGPIDDNWDYLQMSTGGAFQDFADPEGNTTSGSVMAADVTASSSVVAFRALREYSDSGCPTDEEWVVGFILLDRLED